MRDGGGADLGARILCAVSTLRVRARAMSAWRQHVWVLVGWQVLAALISGTGAFSQLLANRSVYVAQWHLRSLSLSLSRICLCGRRGVNIPTTQSLINYLLLSLHGLVLWRSRGRRSADGAATYAEVRHVVVSANDSADPGDGGAVRSARCCALEVAWWQYLAFALCDVEGNFFLVKRRLTELALAAYVFCLRR